MPRTAINRNERIARQTEAAAGVVQQGVETVENVGGKVIETGRGLLNWRREDKKEAQIELLTVVGAGTLAVGLLAPTVIPLLVGMGVGSLLLAGIKTGFMVAQKMGQDKPKEGMSGI